MEMLVGGRLHPLVSVVVVEGCGEEVFDETGSTPGWRAEGREQGKSAESKASREKRGGRRERGGEDGTDCSTVGR